MAVRSISVTELKCACLDPQWREAWQNGEKPPTKVFGHSGVVFAYGSVFHKLADIFTGWLTDARNSITAVGLTDENALWQIMYDHFAQKEIAAILESGQVGAAYHLGQCLKEFCRHAAKLRSQMSNFRSWQDIYVTHEFPIRDIRFDSEEGQIFISGKIDALRMCPDHSFEIVDYKLSHGTSMKHDLIQLAIYAELFKRIRPGVGFQGVLEYYEPELNEVKISDSELKAIFDEMVCPALHELSKDDPISDSSPDLSDAIRKCYSLFKLDIEIIDTYEAPQLIRYRVKPSAGVKVVSLANRAEDMQVALSLKYPPMIEPSQGCVTIDIPKPKPDMIFWRDVVKHSDYAHHTSPLSFPLGIGVDNQVIVADLSDPNMCHALVAGASGSGKSEFLKTLVASLIAKNSPDRLRLTIIDPKILTFGAFSQSPYLATPIVTEISSAIARLWKAVEDMEVRYRKLSKEGFENLVQRFDAGKDDIPFHIIVFDEFADLILSGKSEKKEFENLVAKLAAKGRAAGVHLVLSTQRPESKIVTGLIKANLPLKICLRVTTAINSKIILDQIGGELLLGRGDLLCHRGFGIERAQSPYISQEELAELSRLPFIK